jgi:serine hydrolase
VKTFVLFIQGVGEGAHKADAMLANSLQKALGGGYDVQYPKMPEESKADMHTWIARIAEELGAHQDGSVVLVGHSMGGVALLKYLMQENPAKPIAGLFLLSTPSWDEDQWNFDDLRLPRDLAAKLSPIPRIFLYHNRDDEIVPFRHLALHAAKLPSAVVREGKRGGHQFGNDLANVADDIKGVTQASGNKAP